MDIQAQVVAAVKQLKPICTPEAINKALAGLFAGLFKLNGQTVESLSPVDLYTQALQRGFYTSNNPMLDSKYRECAVVALLASQEAEANLALHVFIALMINITPAEVVNIVFLTGVYSGVNVLTKSLRVVAKTFAAVIAAAAEAQPTTAEKVINRVLGAFPDQPFEDAKAILLKGPGTTPGTAHSVY